MSKIRKFLLLGTILIIGINLLQSQICPERKLLQSVIYLQNNNELKTIVRDVFPKIVKKKERVDFEVSPFIGFISPWGQSEDSIFDHVDGSEQSLNSSEEYENKYYFEKYKIEWLDSVISNQDAKFVLMFSKPIEKHLTAELLLKRFNLSPTIKMGPAVLVTFIFNDEGIISEVLYSSYNYL